MLVLSHTDGLRINFDQLSQGVLQAARNAGRTAQTHIDVWHFLTGKFTGGIHRSARLAHHHLLNLGTVRRFELLDEIGRQFVGFAAGSAIANGDQIHTMLLAQFVQSMQSTIPVTARLVGIDGRCFDELACCIHHSDFDACPNAWVESQHHAGTRRCCE